MTEGDALEMMSTISLVHRNLIASSANRDGSHRVCSSQMGFPTSRPPIISRNKPMSRSTPPDYATKFADFIRMCSDARKSGLKTIVVATPSVIGDNYAEIIESLSRLAEAGLGLNVAEPEPPARKASDVSHN